MHDFFTQTPHRRYNPLSGEWVLVSPHRTQRPWLGQVEKIAQEERPRYDPECYLCPGNSRAGGARNPPYPHTFVFTNDYAAVLPDVESTRQEFNPLVRAESVPGTSRVLCFSPRHDLTLPEMPVEDIERVIAVWCEQVGELRQKYRWVQVFENKGAIMGASNPHPHGQIWAVDTLPNEPAREDRNQRQYHAQQGGVMMLDYLAWELKQAERVVAANAHWVALVPFWAVWPFEVLLLPQRHVAHLPALVEEERRALAEMLKIVLTKYDNLFETSFPYSMGWHGAPGYRAEGEEGRLSESTWQLHAHFYPPLLRSATVKKFMVGYEMLAEPQRDLTPEMAAARLQELPAGHYLSGQDAK